MMQRWTTVASRDRIIPDCPVKLQFGRLIKHYLLPTRKRPTTSAPLGADEAPVNFPRWYSTPTSDDPFMPSWLTKVHLGPLLTG